MKPLLLLLLIASLAACQTHRRGGYYQDDGPGSQPPPVELAQIPDAVPRPEPRSRGGNRPYTVMGRHYVPLADARGYRERGIASWYGKKFHGKRTSNGETYDMHAMSAAHKTLPLPSYVRVRNLDNGRSVIVRVNDRGPFLHNRLIDLSYSAASKLGIVGTGTGLVEVEAVEPGAPAPRSPDAPPVETASSENARRPLVEVLPAAQASPAPASAPAGKAKLYVQVGAFSDWDNATALRTRLERAGFRPIFIQSVQVTLRAETTPKRIYRVRVGPLASVEAADKLTGSLPAQGISNPTVVVE